MTPDKLARLRGGVVIPAHPLALTSTFESTGPADEERVAVALPLAPPLTAESVVFASSVGDTATGQSIRGFRSPASFVTVNVKCFPVAHGIGDCGRLR